MGTAPEAKDFHIASYRAKDFIKKHNLIRLVLRVDGGSLPDLRGFYRIISNMSACDDICNARAGLGSPREEAVMAPVCVEYAQDERTISESFDSCISTGSVVICIVDFRLSREALP